MQGYRCNRSGNHGIPATWVGAALAILLLAIPASAELLQYGDGVADGRKSIGGGGHLILFDAGTEGRWLDRVEMVGSRYGGAAPPDEDFHLYVVDMNGRLLRSVSLPYSLWQRGELYRRELPIPPIQVPRVFGIGLTFNAERTKGVYVGTDQVAASHSYSWVPDTEGQPMEDVDWMVRVTVADTPQGDPEAQDLVLLKNGEAFFDRLLGAEGDPLTVDTAGYGRLPKDQIASICLGAITSASATTATAVVTLRSGMKIEGDILAMDGVILRIRDATGTEQTLRRSEVARIDFK